MGYAFTRRRPARGKQLLQMRSVGVAKLVMKPIIFPFRSPTFPKLVTMELFQILRSWTARIRRQMFVFNTKIRLIPVRL